MVYDLRNLPSNPDFLDKHRLVLPSHQFYIISLLKILVKDLKRKSACRKRPTIKLQLTTQKRNIIIES